MDLPARAGPDSERPRVTTPGPQAVATNTVTNGNANVARPPDLSTLGELLGDWVGIRMDQVDTLVDEAAAKVAAIPDQRNLWLLFGETLVRLHCLENEVAQLREAVKR